MGKMLFIVNPRAGKGRIRSHFLDIVDIFIKGGWEVEVHTTQEPMDAINTARERGEKVDMVVCSGISPQAPPMILLPVSGSPPIWPWRRGTW